MKFIRNIGQVEIVGNYWMNEIDNKKWRIIVRYKKQNSMEIVFKFNSNNS